MVILGVDAHKRTHTVVAVDENGGEPDGRTVGTTTVDHFGLLRWARKFGEERLWAVGGGGLLIRLAFGFKAPTPYRPGHARPRRLPPRPSRPINRLTHPRIDHQSQFSSATGYRTPPPWACPWPRAGTGWRPFTPGH
jgi:hypothetical protein